MNNMNYYDCGICYSRICENCYEKIYNCPVCKRLYRLKSIKKENLCYDKNNNRF